MKGKDLQQTAGTRWKAHTLLLRVLRPGNERGLWIIYMSSRIRYGSGNSGGPFFPHHWCRRPCFPEELSGTSGPCLHAISSPANQTVSPSADPAASSGNSGSLSGRGCYCKAEHKTQTVRGPLLWPREQKQLCKVSPEGGEGFVSCRGFRLLV